MKRFGSAIFLIALIVMMSCGTAFAADFRIESTYPESGAKNTTKENMCVKVTFSNEVGNSASKSANKDKFNIKSEDGKEIPSVIYYNKKDPKYALIHIDTTKVPQSGKNAIQDDTKYICTIDPGFRDNDGNTLGEETKIEFTTQNQGRGMMIYMIIMVAFMVLMVVFSVVQGRKQLMENMEGGAEEPFNPYKEAKRTGKSVEEVIAEHQKKERKKKNAREETPDEPEEGHYKVKRPHPISEAGSTYKTGRKAKAEARAEKEAEEKARRKKERYSKKKKDSKGKGKSKGKK